MAKPIATKTENNFMDCSLAKDYRTSAADFGREKRKWTPFEQSAISGSSMTNIPVATVSHGPELERKMEKRMRDSPKFWIDSAKSK